MFEDFDEFEDIDIDDELGGDLDPVFDIGIEMRTAVLRKNNMLALLCYKGAAEGAAICRVDPRENRPAVQLYDDPNAALEWYTKSLRTSSKNGWQVIYDGLPLQG